MTKINEQATKTEEFKNLFFSLDEEGKEYILALLRVLISIQITEGERKEDIEKRECA